MTVQPSCFLLLLVVSLMSSPAFGWLPSPASESTSFFATRYSAVQALRSPLTALGMVKDMDENSSSSSSHEHQPHHQQQQQQQQQRNITHDVMKKVRVAKAQAEIDRILQGPDAPIDTEAELEKVVSMNHIPSEQPALDAEMAQLEAELYEAVKQQDFTMASHKKAEMEQLQNDPTSLIGDSAAAAAVGSATGSGGEIDEDGQPSSSSVVGGIDDAGAILQKNAAFYQAFSNKSYKDMEQVWLRHDGDTSVCIHPSHKPLVGSRRISKSWKQMFASTDGSFQRNWMEPHAIRILLKGSNMAIVTCEEHVFCRRFVRGKKRQTELINKLLATNIFRKVNSQWYMSYHHASWHPDSEAAKRALGGGAGGSQVVSTSEFEPTSSLAATLAAKRRRRRRQLEDQEDGDEDEDEDNSVGMNGILGSEFGPILGDGKNKGGEQPKRIIMGGSLSDLLKDRFMGLDNILGDKGKNGKNNRGPPDAIIRFSRMENDDDEEMEDDDEDDDELDVELEDDDDEDDSDDEGEEDPESESVAIIKEWAKSSAKRSNVNGADGKSSSSSKAEGKKKNNKSTLRQGCIQALRKLCDQGSISPRQKRVLLTEIITCSSKGEMSMVEVAYDLLFGQDGDAADADRDTAEEEFADQCRVFAQEDNNEVLEH